MSMVVIVSVCSCVEFPVLLPRKVTALSLSGYLSLGYFTFPPFALCSVAITAAFSMSLRWFLFYLLDIVYFVLRSISYL